MKLHLILHWLLPALLLIAALVTPAHAQDGNLLNSLGKYLQEVGKSDAEPVAPAAEAAGEAGSRNLKPQASGGKRVALVIGNGAYRAEDLKPLANPVNDADDMARELRRFGFDVLAHKNLDRRRMKDAIAEFGRKAINAETALFYYAGHGIQIKNQNYLIPVDAAARSEADIEDEGINVNYPLGEMESARTQVNLVLLDACRNNDFSGKFRSGASRGLAAPAGLPKGTVIVYATDPGNVASDGSGRNGLFTEGLLAGFKGQDLSLDGVLTKASEVVEQKSKGKQTPYINGPKLVQRNFQFIFKGPTTVNIQNNNPDPDAEAWKAAEALNTASAYRAYLESFPSGRYVPGAKLKLSAPNRLAVEKPAAKPPAEPVIQTTRPSGEDPESQFWAEVKSSGSREYYDAYLKQYPKGKYAALARLEIKKQDDKDKADKAREEAERKAEQARQEAEQRQVAEQKRQEQQRNERESWEAAKTGDSVASYSAYLEHFPKGQFAALAQAAKQKAERLAVDRDRQEKQEKLAAEKQTAERERQEAETRRKVMEAERLATEKAAKDMYPGKVFKDCADCPEMVVIPAGSFMMGSTASEVGRENDEGPVHSVSLKSFALGKTEVTVGEFRSFTERSGYRTAAEQDSVKGCHAWDASDGKWDWRSGRSWQTPGFTQNEHQPVVCVSWVDAQAYVKWVNQQQRATYRLPSEAEWEYAARAGSSAARPWGDDPNQACRYANVADQTAGPNGHKWNTKHDCNDGYWFTAQVASFIPNSFGLHDMIGNAWEWTQDCANDSYSGAPRNGSAWTSNDCSVRVARGGSWGDRPQVVRSAYRYRYAASLRYANGGFRLARTLSP